jgi:tripartite-type tricarboxylate transporter receptor subunit TctC
MKTRGVTLLLSFLCVLLAVLPGNAGAQPYPSKPVRIIVPYGPGGGVDIVARILAQELSEQWKVNAYVENRDGAGGLIGIMAAANAAPDGYTLLMASTGVTVLPWLQPSPPYDPARDFIAVTRISLHPLLLITAKDAPYKTLKELIAYAKANPGKLNYATSGKGAASHLEIEVIKEKYGLDMTDVPYKSFGQAMADTMTGRVAFYLPGYAAGLQQVRSGVARALATSSNKRSELLPEVPTFAEELGVPDYEASISYGILVPAHTPADIVEKLHREIAKVAETPELRKRVGEVGGEVAVASPAQYGAEIRADSAKWSKLVKSIGLGASQ